MNSSEDKEAEPVRQQSGPVLDRVIQAFAIAPPTAGMPFGAALGLFMVISGGTWSSTGWLTAVGGGAFLVSAWAYPVALVLGVPLYILMRERVPLTPLHSAIVGGTIGGLVAAGLLGAAAPQLRDLLLMRGLIGWPHLLGLGFICGVLPGLVFCAIATRR